MSAMPPKTPKQAKRAAPAAGAGGAEKRARKEKAAAPSSALPAAELDPDENARLEADLFGDDF